MARRKHEGPANDNDENIKFFHSPPRLKLRNCTIPAEECVNGFAYSAICTRSNPITDQYSPDSPEGLLHISGCHACRTYSAYLNDATDIDFKKYDAEES